MTTGEPPRVLAFEPRIAGREGGHVYDDVSGCIRSHPGDNAMSVSVFGEVRRLTETECARLQGFPDGWSDTGIASGAQYATYGNSMAVPVIRWIGARVEAVLNDTPYTYGIPEAARDEIEGRNACGAETVCTTGDVTHTLTAEGHDASEDGTGRGTPICVHADAISRDGVSRTEAPDGRKRDAGNGCAR